MCKLAADLLTSNEKEILFQNIILNNAPNKFVYNQLQQTLINNPNMIVPFVGAGLSQFAYKAWGALLQDLLDQLADQALDAPTRAKIQSEIDQGDFFNAADDLETLIESDVFFFSLVSACNESKLINDGIPDSAAVKWLPKVFPDSRIITTNYDCVLEMAYAQEKKYLRVCTPSDSRMFMQFMPRRLFKIHGSYDSNYEDIVLTSKSYEEKYKKGSLLYNNFKHIVQSSILLFLGASLRTDKTLDILKEIADELSVGGHYCGNMHYAIVHIDNDDDKILRRKELAEYKILPILYSSEDHRDVADKHAIVSIVLEKLYREIAEQFIQKAPTISKDTTDQVFKKATPSVSINTEESAGQSNSTMPIYAKSVDPHLMAQLVKQDPIRAFAYALSQNNLSLAESVLPILEQAVPREVYVSKILAVLASKGSSKAALILLDSLDELKDNQYSSAQLIDVAGSLVSYCNRQDKETQYLDRMGSFLNDIMSTATDEEKASICNQLSRLYYGASSNNGLPGDKKDEYHALAKKYSEEAIQLDSNEPSYYYNLAIIQEDDNLEEATNAIRKCLEHDTTDLDHLLLAHKLFEKTNDLDAKEEVFQMIQKKSPYIAQTLTDGN